MAPFLAVIRAGVPGSAGLSLPHHFHRVQKPGGGGGLACEGWLTALILTFCSLIFHVTLLQMPG